MSSHYHMFELEFSEIAVISQSLARSVTHRFSPPGLHLGNTRAKPSDLQCHKVL